MRFILTALVSGILVLASGARADQATGYADHMGRAGEAFQSRDWEALNANLDEAQMHRPYSLYVWKNRILARQLAGRTDEALALAEKIAARGLYMELSGHEAFEALTAAPDYAPIAARMKTNMAPVGAAQTVFTTPKTNLLPEAITQGSGETYVGSVRTGQVLKLGRKGALSGVAFAPGGVFDLEVRDGRAWAAVNNQLAYENGDPDNPYAAVMAFDLATGAVATNIRIGQSDALLGDIEVASDGYIYASDSNTPRIFQIASGGDTATVFSADSRFANLQGIALDEENGRLFVADYLTGLYAVDLATGEANAIDNAADAHLGGVDGLYVYEGDLIGIQNGTTPQRIVRFRLDDAARAVEQVDVIQQNLDGWNEPTHGYVADDTFFYIATSNWPSYDDAWKERNDRPPRPLSVMAAPLN